MIPSEILMILFASLGCIYCIYTDIKFRLIKNRIVLALLIFAWISHSSLCISGVESWRSVTILFFGLFLMSFLLYFLGFWNSGDAKLFWAVSFSIPLSLFHNQAYALIQSMTINTFIPVFAFLMISPLAIPLMKRQNPGKNEDMQKFIKTRKPKKRLTLSDLVWIIFTVFSLSWIFHWIKGILSPVILIVAIEAIGRLPKKLRQVAYLISTGFTLYLISSEPATFLLRTAVVVLIYIPFRYFVAGLGNRYFTRKIRLSKLAVNMIPAETILCDKNGIYRKKPMIYMSWVSPLHQLFKKDVKILFLAGTELTQPELDRIKDLYASGKLRFDNILIHQTMPFAPMVSLGFILTLLLGGELLYPLQWLDHFFRLL